MLEKFKDSGKSSTQDLLKSILDSALYGLMAYKSIRNEKNEITDFECLFVNDIAEEIVGKSTEQAEGHKLSEILPETYNSDLFNKYCQVVETGNFLTFEQNNAYKKTNKWYRLAAVKLADGFTVTFQDITDLKDSILEARDREKKYQNLFEESIDPIFTVDENFSFLDANPAFQNLFSCELKELVCLSLGDFFIRKDDYNLFRKKLLDQGKIEEFEINLKDSNDREMSCLINCVLIAEDKDGENSFLGVIRDMTKRKQADREILIAEKLAMTGKIARTIAHEIRNPLTNLTLALQQLQDEIPDDLEDTELYFSIIQRNADRIGNLISDLLNSSKAKELKLVEQSINELIKRAVDLVKDRLKLQHMKLEENYEKDLPEIPLDSDQFKIALINLFVNAIEAMEPNKGLLKVETSLENERIKLIIQDNGKGISQKNLENLFEPFFTEKKEGTGLGLTAVQNIIHSHKGHIEAESEMGKGTTFYIFIRVQS